MAKDKYYGKTLRKNFARHEEVMPMPNLLEIQKTSYREFLDTGLREVFADVGAISDYQGNLELTFIDFRMDEAPKYNVEECKARDATYAAPLKVTVRLRNKETEEIKEQEIFMGDFPLMTHSGTFVINGAERVIVSQIVRSPGVYFGDEVDKTDQHIYSATVIPYRGAWLEYETDFNNVFWVRIDKNRKLPITCLIRALGVATDGQITEMFGEDPLIKATMDKDPCKTREESLLEIYRRLRPGEPPTVESSESYLDALFFDARRYDVSKVGRYKFNKKLDIWSRLSGQVLAEPVTDPMTGEIIAMNGETVTREKAHEISRRGVSRAVIEANDRKVVVFSNGMVDMAQFVDFDPAQYGIKEKVCFNVLREMLETVPADGWEEAIEARRDELIPKHITKDDILASINYLCCMVQGAGTKDDIDHLGNRRLRCVGELLQNQFRVGFTRLERVIRERMTIQDLDVVTPQSLINIRPVTAVIKEFFGSSPLSQFMDQNNPLAELTHKRRLSALGPGGLSRDRAGFEVRDVHYTHYGRLCPIESPEGPNIGLISSLCVYAKISPMGFIETPYRRVENGKVDMDNSHIHYYSAEEEEDLVAAQANTPIDGEGNFLEPDRIKAREGADFPVVTASEVDLMDVAPNQIASIAASLIPFLEHDDANRALMGSNMMRQAVPLVTSEAPIVGTGIEKDMISDSRIQIVAEGDGEVVFADATKIQIKYERTEDEILASFAPEVTTYTLPRYRRTNQNTSVTLKPIVLTGDKVTKGQILTEGYSTQHGELALGRNLKVAFMPWKGYNFEDAIVISERIQREDIFTSVHVDEYIMEVRDTKRGVEELTSDIPNVSEDATKDLDANGIVRVGANIHPGDILIGKITPKGESDPSPEEKLLRAIFGDKAGDVKDASLKAQPSLHGVVIDTRLYSRANKEGKKSKSAEKAQLDKLDEKFAAEIAELTKRLVGKLWTLLQGKTSTGVTDYFGVELYPAGTKFSQKMLEEIARKSTDEKTGVVMGYLNLGSCNWTGDAHTDALIEATINNYTIEWKKADAAIKREKYNITNGDELPQTGVIQMAKVYIAKKRKLKVGDKMAGRHGNKGIVARIVRDEDMPFLEDGTIVDICLNPLGVPSRMNLGQIYETVLGWAGRELGLKFATPIFDGASLDQINEYTAQAGIPHSGRTYLYDGGTGEMFDQPATVGVIYMLKLGHMIDDKMHARSIGPYSLITQQPLGGKAQFGGQRFGEMEVWALEGFGAANILQEILTIKSDDVMGRAKAYEAIVKGENLPKPGIPEAMNVLLHELRGLALSVKLE